MPTLNQQWTKPTRTGSSGNCVEARYLNEVIEVRNSNAPHAGSVTFTASEWETFIAAVSEDGEFRLS